MTAGFGEASANSYADLFKAQEMEIDMISELSHELLIQMGVTKAGPRIKILRLVNSILHPNTDDGTSTGILQKAQKKNFSLVPHFLTLLSFLLSPNYVKYVTRFG